jgi:hypothetical protein
MIRQALVSGRPGPLLLAALLALLALGCGKKAPKPGDAPAAPAGPPFEQAVLASLKDAGFTPGAFQPAEAAPYGATRCVRGPIERLDVLLCNYPSPEAAKAAEPKVKGFAAGAVSGAVRRAGAVAMAVADRDKVDLPGKQITRLLRVFTGQPADPPAPPAPAKTAAK